jgi:hypothetical protein
MSQVQPEPETTELKSQYATQLATDLERNTKEQERIGAEVAALEQQLRALRHDQALLVSMRQALDVESTVATPRSKESIPTAPSVPRQASSEPRPTQQKNAAATKPKKTAAKKSETKATTTAAKPTLVELIHNHLSQQSEPRSAAEITAALTQSHPDRTIKTTVVRTTVEGLVAKGRVHRTKQGTSVYYTASETEPASGPTEQNEDAVTA